MQKSFEQIKMNEDDLTLNSHSESLGVVQEKNESTPTPMYVKYLMFDLRRMFIYVVRKWHIVLMVFVLSTIICGISYFLLMRYARHAWTANAVIHHQEVTERLPAFYIPIDTATIAEMFTLGSVFQKVSEELKSTLPEFSPSLLSNVTISLGKSKSGIINVSASANSPTRAAAVANAVADFGISEYITRQNSSLKAMLDEKLAKRTQCLNEITNIKRNMDKFISKEHKSYPPEEIQFLKEHLHDVHTTLSKTRLSVIDYKAKAQSIEAMLKTTPKEEAYETTIDHTTRLSLDGKLMALKQLRKRYTDENPKVAMLLSEIEDLKKQEQQENKKNIPSKITYRKNPVYENLQAQLMDIQLQKKSIADSIAKYEAEYEEILKDLAEAQEKLIEYEHVKVHLDSLISELDTINKSIQNLEIMYSTAIPGLSILSRATPPKNSNINQPLIKTFFSAFFITALFVAIMVFRKAHKMLFISSREFELFGIKDFGEIPNLKDAPDYIVNMNLLKSYSAARNAMQNKKSVLFVIYDNYNYTNSLLDNMNRLNSIHEVKTYTITCSHNPNSNKDYDIEQVSENECIFEYSDKLHVSESRLIAIASEIEKSKSKFGRVQVRVKYRNNEFAIAQLAQFVDSVIFMPTFNKTKKPSVVRVIKNLKYISSRTDIGFGGILMNSPKFVD